MFGNVTANIRRASASLFGGFAVAAGLTFGFCASPVAEPSVSPSAKGARVYFHYPRDGASTPQRFTVRIGLKEMGVAPAGVTKPNTGHHHLLVDVDAPPLDRPIPSDYSHIHLGGGQTEVVLTLSPGRHTLQLLLGDHDHVPHIPPVISKKIIIHVR